MASPKKHTRNVRTVAAALKKARGLHSIAADALGVHRSTVGRYIKKHPSLQRVVEEQKETIHDIAEHRLWEAVNRGDLKAIDMVLKGPGRDRGYDQRTEIDVTGLSINIGVDAPKPEEVDWEKYGGDGRAPVAITVDRPPVGEIEDKTEDKSEGEGE